MKFSECMKLIHPNTTSVHVFKHSTDDFRIINLTTGPADFAKIVQKEYVNDEVKNIGAVSQNIIRIEIE